MKSNKYFEAPGTGVHKQFATETRDQAIAVAQFAADITGMDWEIFPEENPEQSELVRVCPT